MFEEILSSITNVAGSAVEQNPNVDNAHKEGIASEAVSSIQSGIQNAVSSGNISELLGFFTNKEAKAEGNPVVQGISTDFISNITQKFGLGSSALSLGAIIPLIFNLVKSKLGGSLGNAAAPTNTNASASEGGLGSILGSFSGILDQNKDGKVDLSDASGLLGSLTKMFGGK